MNKEEILKNVKTKTMKVESRISARFGQTYYTVEFGEEVDVSQIPEEYLQTVRDHLWSTANKEVDNQIEQLKVQYEQSKLS